MHVLALLDRVPLASRGVQNLGGEFVNHRLLASFTRVRHEPAHGQRDAACGADFDRDLIIGATDALRFDLDLRLKVINRLLEDLQRVFLRTLFDLVKSLVDDALGHRLLAVPHHRVDEFGDERAVVNRIGQDFAFWDFSSSWHISFLIRVNAATGPRLAGPLAAPTSGLLLLSSLRGPGRRALFRTFRAVFRAPLFAVGHANRIERAAHDVITNARQVFHTAPANQHYRVLLQVVADAGDV